MLVYVSGGCKNGKTDLAQQIAVKLSGERSRVYLATMIPYDDEDRARIQKHIENRKGLGFETAEEGRDILSVIERYGTDTVYLVDSVTALLQNAMYPEDRSEELKKDMTEFADRASDAVFVSDYIFSEAERYSEETLKYMRSLADIDKAMAQLCDVVIEMCGGNIIYHKGKGLI